MAAKRLSTHPELKRHHVSADDYVLWVSYRLRHRALARWSILILAVGGMITALAWSTAARGGASTAAVFLPPLAAIMLLALAVWWLKSPDARTHDTSEAAHSEALHWMSDAFVTSLSARRWEDIRAFAAKERPQRTEDLARLFARHPATEDHGLGALNRLRVFSALAAVVSFFALTIVVAAEATAFLSSITVMSTAFFLGFGGLFLALSGLRKTVNNWGAMGIWCEGVILTALGAGCIAFSLGFLFFLSGLSDLLV